MCQIKRKQSRGGFTLVEILLVLVILTTLAAIVVPKFSNRSKQAKETATLTQISTFEVALDAFEIDNGYYPDSSSGLEDLMEKPSEADNWQGPYMKREVVSDPWGEPYYYEYPGKHNKDGYDLWSTGPDRRAGGDDDIVNWTEK